MSISLAIIGAGDLGLRVAQQRIALGDEVWAMRRRALSMPDGVHRVVGDMFLPESLQLLPRNPDVLLFCPTPDERTESAYRHTYLHGIQRALECLKPKRTLFVSSTAVYAQNDGQCVNENSPAESQRFNGKVLLEAEHDVLQHPNNAVLRLSGITGPGRTMLINKALLGEGIANTWTNRIHIDDAASAIAYLMTLENLPTVINVSDDVPALQVDVANWIRKQHQLPPIHLQSTNLTGKKISNRCLKDLGWQAKYPSYKESYS